MRFENCSYTVLSSKFGMNLRQSEGYEFVYTVEVKPAAKVNCSKVQKYQLKLQVAVCHVSTTGCFQCFGEESSYFPRGRRRGFGHTHTYHMSAGA